MCQALLSHYHSSGTYEGVKLLYVHPHDPQRAHAYTGLITLHRERFYTGILQPPPHEAGVRSTPHSPPTVHFPAQNPTGTQQGKFPAQAPHRDPSAHACRGAQRPPPSKHGQELSTGLTGEKCGRYSKNAKHAGRSGLSARSLTAQRR